MAEWPINNLWKDRMNKMVLLALLCTNMCFAGDRINHRVVPQQMPVLFVMAANIHNPMPREQKQKRNAQPRKQILQKNQKYPQQNKPNIKQPKRGY